MAILHWTRTVGDKSKIKLWWHFFSNTSLSDSPEQSVCLCIFPPTMLAFGVFSHSKGLGAKWHVCVLGFFLKWLSPPKRFFGVFPKLFCTFVSESRAVFGDKWLLLQKRFCGGFPQPFSTFVSQMAVASKKVLGRVPPTALYIYLPASWGQGCLNCWHVSTIQIESTDTTHHIIAVGVFFGSIQLREIQHEHCFRFEDYDDSPKVSSKRRG